MTVNSSWRTKCHECMKLWREAGWQCAVKTTWTLFGFSCRMYTCIKHETTVEIHQLHAKYAYGLFHLKRLTNCYCSWQIGVEKRKKRTFWTDSFIWMSIFNRRWLCDKWAVVKIRNICRYYKKKLKKSHRIKCYCLIQYWSTNCNYFHCTCCEHGFCSLDKYLECSFFLFTIVIGCWTTAHCVHLL